MTLPEISLWLIKFSKNSLFTERICILRFHLVNFLCWANIFSPGHPSNSSLLKLKIYKPKQSSFFVDLSSVSPCLASLDVAVFDVSWRRQASTFPSNIEPLTWSPDPLDCPAIAKEETDFEERGYLYPGLTEESSPDSTSLCPNTAWWKGGQLSNIQYPRIHIVYKKSPGTWMSVSLLVLFEAIFEGWT